MQCRSVGVFVCLLGVGVLGRLCVGVLFVCLFVCLYILHVCCFSQYNKKH